MSNLEQKENQTQRKRKQAGFTLVEMMIVVAIIALIGSLVVGNLTRKFDEAKVSTTKVNIKQLMAILTDFYRVCGFYPTTEQGLDALIKPPVGRTCKDYPPDGFLPTKKVPQDPWNRDFVYTYDGNKPTIKSLGANGQEGGEGINKDISSDDID